MKRLNLKTWLLAATATVTLAGCDMMKEDMDDCPSGLYVNFVYDYNMQRADMFKDHVGAVQLLVYDESDRMVASKTMGDGMLSGYGKYIHFSEQELAPGHNYRLVALAMQNDFANATQGYKYRITGNNIGDQRQQLTVTLDHEAYRTAGSRAAAPFAVPAQQAYPLDTLWHTLTAIATPASMHPVQLAPVSLTPAQTQYTWQRDGSIVTNGQETVAVIEGEPTYVTMSLIRDTKHLNITLRALNEDPADNQVLADDYTVQIVDNNTQVDFENNLSAPADTAVYRPYRQWTTSFVGSDAVASEHAAHYDMMFNRLLYKNASVQDDQYAILDPAGVAKAKNAVLLIKKAANDSIIFGLNLPYILSSGRTYQERYYHYQEYLDREYDYRLQFILKGGRVQDIQLFLGTEVHIIPWAVRTQHEELQ